MIGRAVLGWQAYHSSVAPIPRQGASSESRVGRPVANLYGDDIHRPPVLEAPCRDRSLRGQAANYGPIAHGGFKDAVFLRETLRQGAGGEKLRGDLTRLIAYRLDEEDADWPITRQLGPLPKGQLDWAEARPLSLRYPLSGVGLEQRDAPTDQRRGWVPARQCCGAE